MQLNVYQKLNVECTYFHGTKYCPYLSYQNNFVKTLNTGYLGKNIIARIPISTTFNVVTFNNASDGLFKTRDYFGPVRLEKLRIRLLDRFGQVISLNQNDFQ